MTYSRRHAREAVIVVDGGAMVRVRPLDPVLPEQLISRERLRTR
jgi:hypothetical protein